jgi:hypothetical protein
MLKLWRCSIPHWQAARLADGIRRRLRGSDSFSEFVADLSERGGAETSPRRQLLSNDGKSLRSVTTQQSQITVPNFVPFVPEIVPYPAVNPSYSIVLSRTLL